MSSKAMSPNHREALTAISTITGQDEYLTSTNGALNTTGGGGGGGGTQYTEGATTSPATGTVALGRYSGSAPTLTNGQLEGLQLDSSGNLKVTGSLSVGGTTDEAAFTAGSSTFTASGGVFNDSIANLTSGQQGAERLTTARAVHSNLRDSSGNEVGIAAAPLQVSLANTGSNATAVKVDGSAATQPVSYTSVVNAGNSSTATLLANATFTGTGVSTLSYSRITVQVDSDQNSAANGVQLQFSEDNTNWTDASNFSYTVGTAPNHGQTYGVSTRGQYFRVVYTNGSVNQTSFALQTVLHPHLVPGDMVTMATVPNSSNHAILTKSSIVGLTTGGGGGFVDVKVNPSGSLATASSTFDGNGTAITSNSTTTTATTGLDMNIRSILNTAPTTPGFLDIKGADGNVFVRQATATNLKTQAENYQGGTAVGAANPLQVTLANTGANATAVKVDGSGVTQPVSGTVTANIGTTNGLALDATLTGGNQQVQGNIASASSDSGNPVKVGAKYNATRPTFTDGQRADLQVDPRGNLGIMMFNGANPASYGADNADAVATSATADKQRMISRPSTYNGTSYDRIYSANAVSGTTGTGLVGSGAMVFDGTNWQKAAGSTTGIVSVTDKPATAGGLSIVTGSVGATATAIKASAGQLYGYHLFNTTAAVAYVQIFNVAAASVTLGTTSPTISIGIPASGGVTVNFDKGIAFGTAISFACTTTRTGSTGATCDVNFFYN